VFKSFLSEISTAATVHVYSFFLSQNFKCGFVYGCVIEMSYVVEYKKKECVLKTARQK
jgi:hypothetical protein